MDDDLFLVQNVKNEDHIEIISSDDDDATAAAWRRATATDARRRTDATDARRRADATSARRRDAATVARLANKITLQGPRTKSNDMFDSHCVFPNKVALKRTQVQFMNEVARQRPTLKLYVCTMHPSNIDDPKEKMYFSRKFSNACIFKYINLPTDLRVFWKGKECGAVTIIKGKGKHQGSQITSYWNDVVEMTEIQTGDIFMFLFRRSPCSGLKLMIEEVV